MLTLGDPDQLKNLPQEPARTNDNTYARMDSAFHLYNNGSEYIRVESGNPVNLVYSNSICFTRSGDLNPKLTIGPSVTTSA